MTSARSSSSNMDRPTERNDLQREERTPPGNQKYVYCTCSRRVPKFGGAMQKKLTITIDEDVYRGLYERIGTGKISRFIEQLVRPHVLPKELDDAYAAMARDEVREADASEWAEGLMGDALDDSR